jgi:phage/plasmid-like protein (TIGR03299 family)
MIENNMMAYKGAEPWHGLGFRVDENATGAEMLTKAGLEWKVQRRAIAMRPSNGDRNVMLTSQLDGFRAIVRSDNDVVFQVASDRYQPVQNAEIIDFFREYCEAGHAVMETVGGLRNGAVVWALARLNGGSTMEIQRDGAVDELKGYMLLATSHDGSLKTIGKPTQVRVVCHNTLTAAIGSHKGANTFSMRHTRKFDSQAKDEAQKVMGMAIQQVKEVNEVSAQLARVTIDHDGWMEFMGKLMGDSLIDPKTADLSKTAQAIQDATISSPGSALATARGTLWGAVNGVTWFADHAAKSRSDANRMFSAWFGPNEGLKVKALEVGMEMAGLVR